MNSTKKIRRIVLLGLCVSLALILSYIEALLPPLFPSVPGIKIGLANIVTVFLLYRYGALDAAGVSLLRIVLSSLLFGNAFAFLYSVAGAVLSLAAMAFLKKTDRFSFVGVSVAGGILHNLGQTLVAVFALGTAEIGYYMIVLSISGTVAGVIVGSCAGMLLSRLERVHR